MNRFQAPTLARDDQADVMLLLEGTYPFVSGGVSGWVHQIIRGLPETTFGLLFIGSAPERYERMRYTLPANVVHLEEHYLSEVTRGPRVAGIAGDRAFHEASARFHEALRGEAADPGGAALVGLTSILLADPARCERDFLFSERAWETICTRYERTCPDRSFLEYFWTIRSMHTPLMLLARTASNVPRARTYHVVSTGFAGYLGSLLKRAHARPLVMTEHGIYTKERRIELLQASWIKEDDAVARDRDHAGMGFFRERWVSFFEALGRMAYDAASPIVSLYEGNRQRQILDGADPERTRVVPNGIDVARFAPLRQRRTAAVPRVLGLVGRVVPIKDIKTFIRAMSIVCAELAGSEGWIVGPDDEDRTYAEECRELARSLGLIGRVQFLGFRDVEDIFPRLGLNVLTSISEAQPLVVLEGFAAGVPCVASDVGCCRELIEGAGDDDRALGRAGCVVGIADAEATARGALDLLGDPPRWLAAQRAGIERVERFYTEKLMIERYRAIYTQARGS